MRSERRPLQDGEYGRSHLGEETIDLFEYICFCTETSGMMHKKPSREELAVRVRPSVVERKMDIFYSLFTQAAKSFQK